MDGQQRINALKLGFEHNRNDSAMLWIDLNPNKEKCDKNFTRKFCQGNNLELILGVLRTMIYVQL